MSLRIGLFYPNTPSLHAISPEVVRRSPDVLDMKSHVAVAQTCEAIGLDYLFMAEAWGPYGPLATEAGIFDPALLTPLLAATLIPVTSRIRLITTIHTAWFHPLAVARMGGALDSLSEGRWGVNMVSGAGFADKLVGAAGEELDHDARYVRAAEFVEVMTQFWSRGEIDFQGEHFTISGTIVGPRTVQQPRPLLVSAGASDAGRRFAGTYADYVFMPGRTPLEECRARIGDIRRLAREAGRADDAVKLQMHASMLVRETDDEAQEASEALAESVDLDIVVEYLNTVRRNISTYDDIYTQLGELELRQIGMVSGARKIHAGADQAADEIERMVREFGCDGIALTFPVWQPDEIRRFGDLVLPRLEKRGLWTHPKTRGWGW